MISVNGRTTFAMCPVDADGKVRVDIFAMFGLRRGDCIYAR